MASSIEMDDMTSKNNMRNMYHGSSGESSHSGSVSPSSQHTTATSIRLGSARQDFHSSAVHMTPVEAIDPVHRLANMGSSFVDYHRKFGLHGRTVSSMEADEVGESLGGRRVKQGQGTHMRIMEKVIMVVSILIMIMTFPFSLIACFRVVRHYERLIVLRMGRIRHRNPMGPGTIFVIPCIDSTQKIDMRERSYDIKSTDIMLADSVQVRIEAVIWTRVICPLSAVVATDDFNKSTHKLTVGMIRRFLGYKSLTDVVSHEREFNEEVRTHINEVTLRFGVKIERVELKTIRLEKKFMPTMAIEGTTHAQERGRSKLSQGELDAAPTLVQAAERLTSGPTSTGLMLRYMQSAIRMAAKSESGTTIFPVPIDFDWNGLIQQNKKQRLVWLDAVAEGKRIYEAEEKEKSI